MDQQPAAKSDSASPPALPPQPPQSPQQMQTSSNPASWVIGMHDPNEKRFHQGRLIGSIDSLIFGIASLLPGIGLIFAIMALPVASKAIKRSKEDPTKAYSGVGMAKAGAALALLSLLGHAVLAALILAH